MKPINAVIAIGAKARSRSGTTIWVEDDLATRSGTTIWVEDDRFWGATRSGTTI